MFTRSLLLAAVAQTGFALPKLQAADPSCAPVHYMVARGSTETAGTTGAIGAFVAASMKDFPGSDIENIDYPAALVNYGRSSAKGTVAVGNQLTAYVNRCPNSKVALVGYSQGAHIIGDSLCGGGGVTGIAPAAVPIDSAISRKVTVIVMAGDPRFIPGQPGNAGNASTQQGLFPRGQDYLCTKFQDRTQSYCDQTDLVCAGGTSIQTHTGYFAKYTPQAGAYLTKMLSAAGAATGAPSTTPAQQTQALASRSMLAETPAEPVITPELEAWAKTIANANANWRWSAAQKAANGTNDGNVTATAASGSGRLVKQGDFFPAFRWARKLVG